MKTRNQSKRKHAKRPAQFQYRDTQAQSVCVAGTFNDLHPSSLPMINSANGSWRLDLPLSPGHYEYALVVDGHWKPDPRCAETVANPFGGMNSILNVPPPEERPN